MWYVHFELIIAAILGFCLLMFRTQIIRWQKKQAEKGRGVVNSKLRELPEDHLEYVAIFGAIICFTVVVLKLIEILL